MTSHPTASKKEKLAAYMRLYRAAVKAGKPVIRRVKKTKAQRRKHRRLWMREYIKQRRQREKEVQ